MFVCRSGKGIYTRRFHHLLPEDGITKFGKDGDDTKLYIKEANKKLAKLALIQEEESKT